MLWASGGRERREDRLRSLQTGVVMGPLQQSGWGAVRGHRDRPTTSPRAWIISCFQLWIFLRLQQMHFFISHLSYRGKPPDSPPHPDAASHCLASGNQGAQALVLTLCSLVPAAPGGGDKVRGKGLSWSGWVRKMYVNVVQPLVSKLITAASK